VNWRTHHENLACAGGELEQIPGLEERVLEREEGNGATEHDVVMQFMEERSEEAYAASEVAALGPEEGLEGGEVGNLGGDAGEVAERPRRVGFRHRQKKRSENAEAYVCGSHNHVIKVK